MNQRRTLFLVILVLGAVLRILVWAVVPWNEFARAGDEVSYYRTGMRLVLLHEQDLFWAPMTGWLVAGLSTILGTELLSVFRLVWVFIDVLNMVALFNLTRRLADIPLFSSGRPISFRLPHAVMAAYSVYVPALGFATHVTGEALSLAFLLAVLNVVALRSPFLLWRMVLGGFLAGLMILTRPNLAPFVIAVGAALLFLNRRARPFFKSVAIPVAFFATMAVLPPGAWVVRNLATTGYAFLNLSYPQGAYRAALSAYQSDLRFLDSSPQTTEVAARRELVARQQRINDELARMLAAQSREERRQVLKDGLLNVQAISPSQVFEGRTAAILRVSEDRRLASVPEQFRRAISRLGRTLSPKTNSLDMMSRARRLDDPAKFGVFALANVEWALVLLGGIAGILGCSPIGARARFLLVSVIAGCSVASLLAHGEPRYSFPFEFALMIGSIAFFSSAKDTVGTIMRCKWKLSLSIGLLLFVGWSWIAAARWGFADAIRWVW